MERMKRMERMERMERTKSLLPIWSGCFGQQGHAKTMLDQHVLVLLGECLYGATQNVAGADQRGHF